MTTPTLLDYLQLLTSQHRERPLYKAVVSALLQPAVDQLSVLATVLDKFDVDNAIGDQLDKVGEWVGLTRTLTTPIASVYFSFDTARLGWDEGVWWNPSQPLEGAVAMDDATYRIMLRAKIAANYWDGSLAEANRIYNTLILAGTGVTAKVQDNFDMTMTVTFSGTLNALFKEIVNQGYIPLRPAGVSITWVI